MAKNLKFHVYAEDGFESAHKTQQAAVKAAQRGANRRGLVYQVVECSSHGFTGGNGKVVCEIKRKLKPRRQ